MSSELPVPRPLVESELAQVFQLDVTAFASEPYSPELVALYRETFELDRMIGVFDDTDLVGAAGIYTLEMSVPGGRVPLAGVTWVSVLPTHRRRGILTSLMRHQLDGLHESGGEAIAGLTASEPPIYGRFGYGLATTGVSLTVPRHKAGLRLPPGTEQVRVRFASTEGALDLRQAIYNRQIDSRPGMIKRSTAWNRFNSAEPPEWTSGTSGLRTVVAERGGDPVGYALYRTREDPATRDRTVVVQELIGDDAAAHAALLRYLYDIDLTEVITFYRPQPADSPLMHLMTNVRAAEPHLHDSLYLRLVDVDRSLSSRTYAAPIDTVIEVVDDFCPWNAGRWRLVGDEKGASCARTTAAADLRIAARELGTAFLGGVTLRALAAAGLVEERRGGAVAEASRAFASDIAPWISLGF
ncbi:MAG TPA: GNAT family N-acetyltransferase [Actinocrinis sp.]|jgi:predicted acetyltransferase|uniref:GNAT family N-acetyltransferase n=1 Tax=Actinocrinis sp. TaxID=1920516 RepID=UPI002DDD7116|nr:GNAT family N-acetyltransferase [Actinocrinis sp.]HEV3168773.1 GNAT family N-acetyltransferase [Actinocrinis sp.]